MSAVERLEAEGGETPPRGDVAPSEASPAEVLLTQAPGKGSARLRPLLELAPYVARYRGRAILALIALTVAATLVGIVMFGSLTGSMLPFVLQRIGFDPASASAPFVATLVDVTGLVIYFTVASLILRGTLL